MSANIRRVLNSIGGWLMSGEVLYCGLNDSFRSESGGDRSYFHLTDKNISDYFNDNYSLWICITIRNGAGYLSDIYSTVAVYSDFTEGSSSNTYRLNFINSSGYIFYINLNDNSCEYKSNSDSDIGKFNLLLIAIPRTDI